MGQWVEGGRAEKILKGGEKETLKEIQYGKRKSLKEKASAMGLDAKRKGGKEECEGGG